MLYVLGNDLTEDASVALYTGLYELYGVALAVNGELLVEHLEFGLYFNNSAFIVCEELLERYHGFFQHT